MKVTIIDDYLFNSQRTNIWEEVEGEHPNGIDNNLKILKRMFQGKKVKETEDDDDDEDDKPPYTYNRALNQIRINGDTQNKVSHLIIAGLNLQVTDADLQIDTLTLAQSTLDEETKNINVNNLLADYASCNVIFNPKFVSITDHVKTKQFTYYTSYDYNIRNDELIFYQILYNEDSLQYQMVLYNEEKDEETFVDSNKIPYKIADSFGIIPQVDEILLYSSGPNVKSVKDLNITVKNYDPFNYSYMINHRYKENWDQSHELFIIDQDGDWSGVTKPPNLYITHDEKNTKIEIPETLAFIPKKEELYNNYTTKKD